jgi:hypothetical protein
VECCARGSKLSFGTPKKSSGSEDLLLVPRNFSRGRGVVPSLAERGEQSFQRGYFQFGM